MTHFLTTMIHYWWRDPDNPKKITVQNMVGMYGGQTHHYDSHGEFRLWVRKNKIPEERLKEVKLAPKKG